MTLEQLADIRKLGITTESIDQQEDKGAGTGESSSSTTTDKWSTWHTQKLKEALEQLDRDPTKTNQVEALGVEWKSRN